jgi:hypothetical protein
MTCESNESTPTLSERDQYLLEEYKYSGQLTHHMDEIRMRLTGFFLTFNGLAIAGLLVLLKGETDVGIFKRPQDLIAILLLVIALLGVPVIGILASLRRVQIQRYRIMNNIRKNFLGTQDLTLWNVVELSEQSLPSPSRRSGNYYWLLLIMLMSSSVLAFSVYMFTVVVFSIISPLLGYLAILLAFVVALVAEDRFYFSKASPPERPKYSTDNPPFVSSS